MRYLITGGAGFIGGAIARRLLKDGHEVSILDLPQRIQSAPPAPQNRVIAADISHRDGFTELEGPFDAVVHLAAQTSARVSHEEPERDVDTNARGTMLLAQWCVQHGIRRVIYSSSMAVYGNPSRLPVQETDTLAPVSFYGVTKLAGEHYLQAHVPLGLEPTIFRLFNVYGPGQDMANLKQGMLSIYLAYIRAGEPVRVTGSLDRFRDFVYIDDIVDAFMLALQYEESKRQTYNLGTGITYTVRQVLDLLIESYGYKPSEYPVLKIEDHAGDIFGTCADSTKFRRQCGWESKVPLADGIGRMIAWLREGVRQ
jgi:UDP-glucose 4-epimerase